MTSNEYTIQIEAWSGNARPYRATVRVNGRFVGRTGFCGSQGAAASAAERIIAGHAEKLRLLQEKEEEERLRREEGQ